jgi:hypothetical protein
MKSIGARSARVSLTRDRRIRLKPTLLSALRYFKFFPLVIFLLIFDRDNI